MAIESTYIYLPQWFRDQVGPILGFLNVALFYDKYFTSVSGYTADSLKKINTVITGVTTQI